MAELDAIIDELYGIPLEEFTERRNALAKGSPDTKAIRALSKPSVAAWAVNALARAGELDPVLALGDRLRASTTVEQRSLSGERRAVVAAAVRAAAQRAESAGHPISESVRHDVDGTLQAAVLDADAAAAVASGRLVRAIDPSGFGGVDLDGAVAGRTPVPRAASAAAREQKDDDRVAEQERQRELAEARVEAEAALADLEAATAQRDDVQARVDDAEERLAEAQRTVEAVRAEIAELDGESGEADRAVRAAERRARRATTGLEDLSVE